MYYHYFGLQEAPFSIAVDPRYIFMSARHSDALAHLLYGVGVGGGFVLLTGEVGTGKTTIIRCLLEKLPQNIDIALVLNPALKSIELLATVCDELGIEYPEGEKSLKVLTDKLHQFLLRNHAKDRNTVLLIDEAQHLSFDVLEQIRLLTNLETNTKKLLQIILVGQPELRSLLSQPELRQLAQRITARYQLKPLSLQETDAYIRHRLHTANLPGNQMLFPPNVIIRLFKISRGVPRLINVLCDRMLLGTYAQNKMVVDTAILKQATKEVLGEEDEEGLSIHALGLFNSFNPVSLLQRIFSNINLPPKAATVNDKPFSTMRWPLTFIALAAAFFFWWQWPLSSLQSAAPLSPASQPSNQIVLITEVDNSPWSTDKKQAIEELLSALSITELPQPDLCRDSSNNVPTQASSTPHYICEQLSIDTWQELTEYNRMAVLRLVTPAKQQKYAALIGINNDNAVLSFKQGQQIQIPIIRLGKLWTGEFIFVWQAAAPDYSLPISLNDKGPLVLWLANKFALIDGQKRLLAKNQFNSALKQRVKLFQQEHNLKADGVVGLKTMLRINDVLGISKQLLTNDNFNSANTKSNQQQKGS